MNYPELEDYIEGHGILRRRSEGENGLQLCIDCPGCGRNECYVNAQSGFWICYRAKCGLRGNALTLVRELEGCSLTKARILLRQLRDARPIGTVEQALQTFFSKPAETTASAIEMPPFFEPVFDEGTWRLPYYLTDRKITARVAAKYGLGYCPTGPYARRVVIPVTDQNRLVGWQARHVAGGNPKYLSPRWARSRYLMGLDQIDGAEAVAIVEGPFDLLSMATAGVPAVALLGKDVSRRQAVKLQRAGVRTAVMAFDSDAAGAQKEAAQILREVVNVATIGDYGAPDPGDATSEALKEAFGRRKVVYFAATMG